MNKGKAQQEICKALLKGNVVYRYTVNEEEIGVIIQGEKGYIFKLEECIFDIRKLHEREGSEIFSFQKEDEALERTSLLIMYGDMLVRRYKAKEFSVYISEKLAKEFEDEYFFGSKEGDRVLITDATKRIVAAVARIMADEGMIKTIIGE